MRHSTRVGGGGWGVAKWYSTYLRSQGPELKTHCVKKTRKRNMDSADTNFEEVDGREVFHEGDRGTT
jgi:hypothetical protein